MSNYCQDRDLLGIEPIIFLGADFPSQRLIAGANAQISGTTFTCSGDLSAAGVQVGMVLCTYSTTPAEGGAYEVDLVDSSTTMTVSVLRVDVDADPVAPPGQSGVSFHVRSYAVQIRSVSDTLGEKLRQISEVVGIAAADFAESAQLRLVTAYGTLADIFVARSENAEAYDANWIKARHYRQLHRDLLLQLRLAVDTDGDGEAERTRSLGNMTLRRT